MPKTKFLDQGFQKLEPEQTDTQTYSTENIITQHSRVIIEVPQIVLTLLQD